MSKRRAGWVCPKPGEVQRLLHVYATALAAIIERGDCVSCEIARAAFREADEPGSRALVRELEAGEVRLPPAPPVRDYRAEREADRQAIAERVVRLMRLRESGR